MKSGRSTDPKKTVMKKFQEARDYLKKVVRGNYRRIFLISLTNGNVKDRLSCAR